MSRHPGTRLQNENRALGLPWGLVLALLLTALGVTPVGAASVYKVANFGKSQASAPATQVLTHNLGEVPKAVIIWTAGGTTIDFNLSMGFYDGTTQRSVSAGSQDKRSFGGTSSHLTNKAITIGEYDGTVIAEADIIAMDATTLTLNWTTNNGASTSMHYMVIGGSDIQARVVEWTSPASTGLTTVNGVGFEPDLVFHAFSRLTAADPQGIIGFGAMDGAGNEWANSVYSVDGSADADTQRGQTTGACIHAIDNDLTVLRQASFVSMGPDGFTVNFTTAPAWANNVVSLALNGLQAQVGSFAKSAGASQTISGVGFQPDLVLFTSFQEAAQASPVTHSYLGFGASDGSTEGASTITDTDSLPQTDVHSRDTGARAIVVSNNLNGYADADADLTGLNGDGFTLGWATNDGAPTEILYLAVGELAAGPPSISGRVFEDADFAGAASDYDGGSKDVGLDSVDVELYDTGNGFVASVTTVVDGSYNFANVPDGSYKVRVRSATIGDLDTPPAGGLNTSVPGTWPYPLPEMTWGHGAPKYGGEDEGADDTAVGDNLGPGDTFVEVTVSGADVTGVNFGFAYNLIVNVADDLASGSARSRQGSLRQFIKNANAITNGTAADSSQFRIPGGGPHTIEPDQAFPAIVDRIVLDATTEPDFAGTPEIVLKGDNAGAAHGFTLGADSSLIRGFVINNFEGNGVLITGDGNTLLGNYIGADGAGTSSEWNDLNGVEVQGDGNTIGGTNAGDANLLSGNFWHGVEVRGNSNIIRGNLIGTRADGTQSLGNQGLGIWVESGVTNTVIGGAGTSTGNIIAFNGMIGVGLASTAGTGNRIRGNSIHSNSTLGIDLYEAAGQGVTLNDLGDADGGANGLQNFPVLTSAFSSGGNTTIQGSLNSAAGTVYQIDFYSSPAQDFTNHGEGEVYLGAASVTTDGSGDATINLTLIGLSLTAGHFVTATATDPTGSTSEFALNVAVTSARGISGLVFEDVDFVGTATGYDGGGDDRTLSNVDVELYDADSGDTYVVSDTTDATGNFSFTGLSDGNYKVRVRSATIGDADTPPTGGLNPTVPGVWAYPLPEMTWAGGAVLYGGQSTDIDDTATGDDAGPGDTWIGVAVSGAEVADLEFGFAYNLIVNTPDDSLADDARSRQGSLRQYMKNANATVNGTAADTSRFRFPGPGPHTLQPVRALPAIADAVHLDATTEPDYAGNPIVEIDGTLAGATDCFSLSSGSTGSDIRGFVINRFDGHAIRVFTNDNTIAMNYLGTDVTGMLDQGNTGSGIYITSSDNAIGGSTPGAGNVISGNTGYGIKLAGASTSGNTIWGNLVGLDVNGTGALANDEAAVEFSDASSNVLGGTDPGARNVIVSKFGRNGIRIISAAAAGNKILGNYIGTNAAGDAPLSGGTGCIYILNGVQTEIGGTDPGAGNVLGGYSQYGISTNGQLTTIEGNFVGTDTSGTLDLTSGQNGIVIQTGGTGMSIGGTTDGASNIIANNSQNGVSFTVNAGTGNRVNRNSIHSNGQLGIDLGGDGVTTNDLDDIDPGPNELQNFPVLTSATTNGVDTLTIGGTLNSVPGGDYRIEFFANTVAEPGGYGEGETYLGFTDVVTDGGGDVSFSVALAVNVPGGANVSATATDVAGNTSEFAARRTVGSLHEISGLVFEDADFAGVASDWDGGSPDAGLDSVDVELYGAADTYITSVTTSAGGSFSFTGLADGAYKIRARSATIGDSNTPPTSGLNPTVPATWPYPLPEMTWANGAALYGGQDPTVDDTATDDNAGPGDTWVVVSISGSDVANVHLGFAYNLIVHTGDDGNATGVRSAQGSLRQFIKNTNAVVTAGTTTANFSQFRVPTLDPGFDIPRGVAVFTPISMLPPIADAGGVLDGTTQTTNVGDTNPGTLGYVGAVGLGPDALPGNGDEPTISGVARPEVEIQGSDAIKFGLQLRGDDVIVRGVSVFGFGTGGLDANVLVGDPSASQNNTGCIVEHNILGAPADDFSDPGVGVRSSVINILVRTADDGFIRENLLGFVGRENIRLTTGTLNWQITRNEIRQGGLESTFGGVTLIADATGTVSQNLIVDDAASAGILAVNAVIQAQDNTLSNNPGGGIVFWQNQGGMQGSGQISQNQITGNGGSGVAVLGENGTAPATVGVSISRNHFTANSGIAIDIVPSWTSDGITLNDGTLLGDGSAGTVCGTIANQGNEGLDTPIIDSAYLDGGTATVTGRACPGSQVEIYRAQADGDGSDTIAGDDYGEGLRYLGNAAADPSTGAFILAGVTSLSSGDSVSAIVIDSASNTSEFGANVPVLEGYAIAGTVFEDVDGDLDVTDDGVGRSGVIVLLYLDGGDNQPTGADDILSTSTTTGPGGAYTVNAGSDGIYWVAVDSKTLTPSAGLNSGSVQGDVWAEQTYGTEGRVFFNGATYGIVGGAGAFPGGMNLLRSDSASTLATSEHVNRVAISGADETGVDFGFSFNVVTRTGDGDDEPLADRSVQGSLRQLIQNANAVSGTNISAFSLTILDPNYDLSGNGEFTIRPTALLPPIQDRLVLDGATQSGYSGQPIIEIDGSLAPGGGGSDGLIIQADGTSIRELVINRFGDEGITVLSADSVSIQGNYIGTDVSGALDAGNTGSGISLRGVSSYCRIGGTAPGAGNVIAFNRVNGIRAADGVENSWRGNSIHSNGTLGIDLDADGVTANDLGDPDAGANTRQNYPVLSSFSSGGGNTTIIGTLNSSANSTYYIDFYSSTTMDPTEFGEGETYLGSETLITDGSGNATINTVLPVTVGIDRAVAATATDASGNTSEFSRIIKPSSDLAIIKRAYLPDGTPVPDGTTLPRGTVVKFLLYVNNDGSARSDISVRDVLDSTFAYIPGTLKVDNSASKCSGGSCTAAEEVTIFSAVEGSTAGSDQVDGDVVSFNGSTTIDAGDRFAGNGRLDIAGSKVWALLFAVKISG